MNVLLSAYACDPSKGSEPAYGYNWAIGLADLGYEVHCMTQEVGKTQIELKVHPSKLHFHYVRVPFYFDFLYSFSQPTIYLHYLIWQWLAYNFARRLHKKNKFDIAHHVTFGSLQMGSFLYKLNIPFIFGPAGGGQTAPVAFKDYFLNHWSSEERRKKVSELMLRYNPAFGRMIKKAKVILASNPETLQMAESKGARNVFISLDTALPETFFPDELQVRKPEAGKLRLLWIGRFLPRKGILLLVDVMKALKGYTGISLTVVGDGEMRDAFREKVKEFSLQEIVYWKGAVPYDQVKEFYSNHDVFIFTSLRDSGGLQLVEAMAYGLPVVTLNLHGQAIIVNDETGIRCKCETPDIAIEELKNAVIELQQNPSRVSQMSLAAFEFAKKQTWTIKIAEISRKYYSL